MVDVNGGQRDKNAQLREREQFILKRLSLMRLFFSDRYDDYIALCRDPSHHISDESIEWLKKRRWVNKEGKVYPTVKDVVLVLLP